MPIFYKINLFSLVSLEKTLYWVACILLLNINLCYSQLYPQRFCINCKHWLDKIKKAYFQHHSETDCNICNISMAKHQKLANAHIKLFDKKFSNHQFCWYNHGASRDLIYFKPVISKSKVYVPLTIANKGWSDMECICQWRYWIFFNSCFLSPPSRKAAGRNYAMVRDVCV